MGLSSTAKQFKDLVGVEYADFLAGLALAERISGALNVEVSAGLARSGEGSAYPGYGVECYLSD